MNPLHTNLQPLNDNDLIGFDLTTGRWRFIQSIPIEYQKNIVEEVSLINILKMAFIGTVVGFAAGKGVALLGASIRVIKYTTTAGTIFGSVIGYFNKVKKEILVNPPEVQSAQFRIEKERDAVDKRAQDVLTSLFNLVAEEETNITCPISGELLQVPVSAPLLGRLMGAEKHNCGSFEYFQIKREIEQKGRCPLCERAMRLSDLRIDTNKRVQVSRIIKLSLERVGVRRGENERAADMLDADFLRDHYEIIRKIKNQTLDGRELRFISKLVRERVEWYNRRFGFIRDLIGAHLLGNIEKIGEDQYFCFNRQLIEYVSAFKIELPELE